MTTTHTINLTFASQREHAEMARKLERIHQAPEPLRITAAEIADAVKRLPRGYHHGYTHQVAVHRPVCFCACGFGDPCEPSIPLLAFRFEPGGWALTTPVQIVQKV